MRIFDLSFSDGKSCRVIDPDPDGNAEESLRGYQAMFQPGYLVGMVQIIAPPPAKLQWKRVANNQWELNQFVLFRLGYASYRCEWPGGQAEGSAEMVSAAVRKNWMNGIDIVT